MGRFLGGVRLSGLGFLGVFFFLRKKSFYVFLRPNQFLHLVPCLMVVWVESIEVRLLVPKGILSVRLTGIYLIAFPICLSNLHCGAFPSSAQYSSIETILSSLVFMKDVT